MFMKPSKNTEKEYVNDESDSHYHHCTCRLSSMAMDEENAQINSVNHCGSSNSNSNSNSNSKSRNNKKMNNVWLESSFVHLMTPRNIHNTINYRNNNKEHSSIISSTNSNNHQHQHQQQLQQQQRQRQRQQTQHGFLEQHQHLLQLLEVAYNHTNHDETETNDIHDGTVELCVDCIDRVASAFDGTCFPFFHSGCVFENSDFIQHSPPNKNICSSSFPFFYSSSFTLPLSTIT